LSPLPRVESLKPLVVTGASPSGMLGRMSAALPPLIRPGGQLFGRGREREALDRLLAGVRGGRGGVLVL
jgi:hypothetical protein